LRVLAAAGCAVVAAGVAYAAPAGPGATGQPEASPTAAQMEASRAALLRWLADVDHEAFAPGHTLAHDEIVLNDGTTLAGKLLDYGAYICVVDANQRHVLKRDDVAKITASWGPTPPQKPALPDLDVTYIERLPRYRSNHGNVSYDPNGRGVYLPKPNDEPVWPPAGTKATFKAHVVNKGPVASKAFRFEWLIDDKPIAQGTHDALPPGGEVVLDQEWVWQDGAHTVNFRVTPDGADFSAWNNHHSDRTDSLGLSFAAAQGTYDGFNNALNMVESYSYEDWVQYHLQVMNFLFAASIYPASPDGCLERVRVDKMITLPDENYAQHYEQTGLAPDGFARHEGRWGFSPWDQYPTRAEGIDWGLIHELGHQLGIIDYYTLDFWRYAVLARDRAGELIDVGYSYPYTGMMRSHGPYAFEETTAIALNMERGKHRGYFGDYLFYVPKQCGIRLLDFHGRPLANADIRIFRRTAGVHTEDTGQIVIPEKPVFEGQTDGSGVYMLPNEKPPFEFTTANGFTRAPSPFGDALVISDTGLMLIEIWSNGRRDAHFTDVTEFVIGRGRGHADTYIQDIATILPGADDKLKPPQIMGIETDGWCDRIRVNWGVAESTAARFRLYTCEDGRPFERTYMHEIATVNPQTTGLTVFHLNGWVTMTGVDAAGHESAPAPPVFVGDRCWRKLAANSKGDVLIAGWNIERLSADNVLSAFPGRTGKGAFPASAVATTPQDDVVALNSEVSPKGDSPGVYIFGPDGRKKTFFGVGGTGDGQLSKPSDVTCDAAGRIYIADTGNDRVVVFDAAGKFVANVGAGQLAKPVALAVDKDGTLYVLQDKQAGLVKLAKSGETYGAPVPLGKAVAQPTAIACDAAGRIYLAQNAEPGLLVLDGDGQTVAALPAWKGESLKSITGLTFDRRGALVCARGDRGGVLRIPVSEIK
jgi:hypothetical protein